MYRYSTGVTVYKNLAVVMAIKLLNRFKSVIKVYTGSPDIGMVSPDSSTLQCPFVYLKTTSLVETSVDYGRIY